MPECKRCHRVAATAELRRSPSGGHICKPDDRERCTRIARAGEWPEAITQLAVEVRSHADAVVLQCENENVLRTLGHLGLLADAYSTLAGELALRASREGHTQKNIAAQLRVPVSTLRGLKGAAA
jgi:hypothetical protein